jgi:hypothetical protein
MIIDAHAHLGYDEIFDEDFPESALLEGQKADGIDVTLVQPCTVHDLESVRRQHDAISDLALRHPGRFHGIANPNPHLSGGRYEAEVRRCVEKLKFVGIKMHPWAHAVNPLGRHGRRVFALGAELGIPVMVHTGSGIPWSAPSLLGPVAENHPNLRIIVAHAGAMILAGEAALLAERHPNVYLECSWTAGFLAAAWARQFGPERVIFGSDHADNAATELTKFRTSGLTPDELDWVLGRAAARAFNLQVGESRPA